MKKSKDNEILLQIIQKRKTKHLEAKDLEGFSICPILNQKNIRVASRKQWLGTKKSWELALKDQKKMDKSIHCDFCDLCDEIVECFKTYYQSRL